MTDDTMKRISIIVPVYNDPAGIETTLDSLVNQRYPDDQYEILAVDNGSSDDTPRVIKSFAEDHSTVVPLSEDEIQSSYAARNRGIERATGDIIAFIDADMWVDPDWAQEIAELFENGESDYYGCNVQITSRNETPNIAERYNIIAGFPVEEYIQTKHFSPTCCLVVSSSVFEEVGMFDERLISSGDKEFGKRVFDSGFSQQFASDIHMYHPARDSLTSLCKKSYRVGRGRAQLHTLYGDRDFEKTSLLHPKQYLPPIPHQFYRSYTKIGLSNHQILRFYAIAYILQLSGTLGQMYEAALE